MTNIIDEIKQARQNALTNEKKEIILNHVKQNLVVRDFVVIYGASHFPDREEWRIPTESWQDLIAPYSLHPAITDWLTGLGFHCRRWYNRGGIEQGMEVRIY